MTGIAKAVAIAAGGAESMALLDDGTVLAWGSNLNSQLGGADVGASRGTPGKVW